MSNVANVHADAGDEGAETSTKLNHMLTWRQSEPTTVEGAGVY